MKRKDYVTKEEIEEIAKQVEESDSLVFVMDMRRWAYRKVNRLDETDIRISPANARFLFKVCDTKLHWSFGIDDCVNHCQLDDDEWLERKKMMEVEG